MLIDPQALDPLASIREADAILAAGARSGIEGLGVATFRGWKLRKAGDVVSDHLELSIRAALGQEGGCSLGVIELPPRAGKTIRSSVLGGARSLGLDPHLQVVTGSHNRDLANRNVRDARATMGSPNYLAGYRTRLRSTAVWAPGQQKVHAEDRAHMFRTLYETGRGELGAGDGYYLSTSIAAGLTGWGFHLGICDDLIRGGDVLTDKLLAELWEWYQTVFWTRRHPERNAIVLMGTRWHPNDPIGRALALWQAEGMAHYRCRLPAMLDEEPASYDEREQGEWLIPEHADFYEQQRRTIEPEYFEAMYQQRPTAKGGNLYKETDFGYYDPRALPAFEAVVISVDPASKKTGKSRCAIGVWGIYAGHLYRLAEGVGKWDYNDLEREFLGTCGMGHECASGPWPEAGWKLVEDTSNGVPLLSRLRDVVPGLHAIKPPANSKEVRASVALPFVRSGRVLLPSYSTARISARWVKEYVSEMCRFPLTPNDRVDETTQALQWAAENGYFRIIA